MKKKNLIILLLLPFIIATLCIVTVNVTYDAIDVDISFIEWEYKDYEPFQIKGESTYKLKAKGVNRNNYKLADGNELVWTAVNKDGSPEPYAEIVKSGNDFYLKPLKEGEVVVTCATQKGNVSRRMTAIIYKDSVILSQANIDQTVYYGQYDLNGTSKQGAVIDMSLVTLPAGLASTVSVTSTENASFDLDSKKIHITGTGSATVTVSTTEKSASFSFEIVENGVNVYTYDDLLNCTNRSQSGEIVVLRKHFESVENAYIKSGTSLTLRENNIECFGHYDARTDKYSFDTEIYQFETTFNKNFIDQWNEFARSSTKYSEISSKVKAGLRIQKDFYGNGYTLNLHNLTFPYDKQEGTSGQSIPALRSDNLFRGPLSFYTLGDPKDLPLVSAYGQDNAGVYVDGDNITVNDVNIKNCDFGDRYENLDTVGTVMEIHGTGITVKNSRLSNGKTVLRAYSSHDFLLKNCMLSTARNFLFSTGANEYLPIDGELVNEVYDANGKKIRSSINDYLGKGGIGDTLLNEFIMTDYTTDDTKRANIEKVIRSIQSALNNGSRVKGIFKGSTTVEDCLFEGAGIAAISVDSMFNGPYLYNSSPSFVYDVFASGSMTGGLSLVPYTATNVSGTSYPVKLTIKGNTHFYGYKTANEIDLSGLIQENISTIANLLTNQSGISITIDDIFPLKGMVMQKAYNLNYTYKSGGNTYVNLPIAYYGGGINLSEVILEDDCAGHLSDQVEMDLLNSYLGLKGGGFALESAPLRNLMMKTVTTVIGYEPFKFHFVEKGYLYGEHAQISQLVANAKGE